MVIAVNTRFLLKDVMEGVGYFMHENFRRLVNAHPEHQFIFIFDRPWDPRFIYGPNVTPVLAGPAARHPLLWKFWFDVKVPAILKKYKADVFVSCDGFCSLRTSVPQCLVLHDLAFLHFPEGNKKSHLWFYKKYTPAFLAKAASVATVSSFSKNDILKQYAVAENKINVVYSGVKEIFSPQSAETGKAVREQYTEGREFFLYTGAVHPRKNLLTLLKAFSLFKKRLQSGMKLVIAGRLAWKYESFVQSLKSYKYRNDVVLTGYLEEEELAKITGSAWALVYPSLLEGFGVPVLEAMKSDVPVITSEGSSMQEIAGDAALYVNPSDPVSVSEQLMRIYKDENLRRDLISKGRIAASHFSWDHTADLLWKTIVQACPELD